MLIHPVEIDWGLLPEGSQLPFLLECPKRVDCPRKRGFQVTVGRKYLQTGFTNIHQELTGEAVSWNCQVSLHG